MKKYMECSEANLTKQLLELLARVRPLDETALKNSEQRWSKVAKPLKSLGLLEDHIIQIAGITGNFEVQLDKKVLAIFCADNGIVEEGVTQTGQGVTAVVAANITRGDSCACLMAKEARTDVVAIDMGIACELEPIGTAYPFYSVSIRKGTGNFLKGPAMTRQETLAAVLTGIALARELKMQGYQIIATGEMGIGNTTTSSAVASVLLGLSPTLVTGKGAGLSDLGLKHKIEVIEQGIALHRPNPKDGIDVLSKVGGLDLAGMAGIFIGGAVYRLPVVIDGFISAAAAAAATAICENVREYMIASHASAEPAGRLLLDYLKKKPIILADMCLGEGTGAVALMPLLHMALSVYQNMSTFSEIHIEDYEEL